MLFLKGNENEEYYFLQINRRAKKIYFRKKNRFKELEG